MLHVTDLACVRGERRLFSDVSFQLDKGGLLHVQGANGSGKTSLLRLVSGLASPEQGQITWDGTPIRALGEEYYRDVLYVGHANAVKDELSALENVRIATRLGGEPVTEEQACGALQTIGLRERRHLPAKALSQGQKRRVALARLLLTAKPLWILDEPFTALDAAAVSLLQGVLEAHLTRGGMVLLTTHQKVELKAASSNVVGLS
jgi:heme exporter protein A